MLLMVIVLEASKPLSLLIIIALGIWGAVITAIL